MFLICLLYCRFSILLSGILGDALGLYVLICGWGCRIRCFGLMFGIENAPFFGLYEVEGRFFKWKKVVSLDSLL